MASLLLPTAQFGGTVKVQAVVLFSVCDAYIRRSEKQERVIGTLLGTVSDNVIDVKSCYVVPHNESQDQVAVDINHHKTMHDLHARVSPQEVIVGWFSTGLNLSSSDALIQDFYSKEANFSIHLKVDTNLNGNSFQVKAYGSKPLGLGDKTLASEFIEMPTEVLFGDADKLADLQQASGSKQQADAAGLQNSIARLEDLVGTMTQYVQGVVEGKTKGDPVLGRYLADTMAVVPQIDRQDFERLFNENVQDVLLVSYLSNLVRVQLALSDKLGTPALPVL